MSSCYVYKRPLLKSKENEILTGHAILTRFSKNKKTVKIQFLNKIGACLDYNH